MIKNFITLIVILMLSFIYSTASITESLKENLTEEYIKKSSEVFEAEFESIETYYYHNGRLMTVSELNDYKRMKGADPESIVLWINRLEKETKKHKEVSNKDPFSIGRDEGYEFPAWYSLGENGRKFQAPVT